MRRSRCSLVLLRLVSLVAAVVYGVGPLGAPPVPTQAADLSAVAPALERPAEAVAAPCSANATVSLAATTATPFRVTLVATRDSTVDEGAPDTPLGAELTLIVGDHLISGRTYTYDSLVGFSLASLPADAVILTATLELRQTVTGAADTVAQALTGSWNEGTVTWNNAPGSTRTDQAGDTVAGSVRRWDITKIVRKWAAGTLANNGVRLSMQVPTVGPHVFNSRETKEPPRLIIDYALQVALEVVGDAEVSQAQPGINYGDSGTMAIRDDASGSGQHVLLAFDLSTIPAGSSVISASLGVHPSAMLAQMQAVGDVSGEGAALESRPTWEAPAAIAALSVQPEAVLAPWSEGTVTWNSAPPSESQGDPALAWTEVAWNWFDVTGIASAWASGAVGADGIMLKPATGSTGLATLYAREGGYPAQLIVTYGAPLCTPATSVTIGGATAGVTNAGYTFAANVLPTGTTPPITYSWQATDQAPASGLLATRTYTWTTAGTKTITVTATACGQSVQDTHQVVISAPSPTCPAPLTGLSLDGPAFVYTDIWTTYTAIPVPTGATTPITYTWQATDQPKHTGPEATRDYLWSFEGPKTITVTASNCGGTIVQQMAVEVQRRPNLRVTSAWYNQIEARVYAIVTNDGDGLAPAGHTVALSLDGTQVVTATFAEALAPGVARAVGIDHAWTCGEASAEMRVCADATDVLPELREYDNCLEQDWACDLDPPTFTSGPEVSVFGEDAATLTWTTSEPCRTRLDYGLSGPWNATSISDPILKTDHTASLSGLTPGGVVWYAVTITDTAGNVATSGGDFFQTAPPETSPPDVVSLEMVNLPSGTYDFYALRADLADTYGVDRVAFTLDGKPIGTDTSADGTLYEVMLSPAALGYTRLTWFASHTLQVRITNLNGASATEAVPVTPDPDPMDVYTFIQKVAPSNSVFIGGSVAPPGTTVTVTAWAAQYPWGCTDESPEPTPPGLDPVRCVDVRQDVWSIKILLDGVAKKTVTPGTGVLSEEVPIDLSGVSLGTHTLTVRATSSDGQTVAERDKTLTLVSGATCADVTRQVTRTGNTFQVDLTVRNPCNTAITLRGLEDRGLVGFYPAAGAGGSAYTLASTSYDVTSQRAAAVMTIDNVVLAPGGQLALRYTAVPMMHDQGYAGNDLAYSLGLETDGLVTYTVGTDPTEVARPFYAPWTGSVADALRAADYLIITNPKRLATFYPDQEADITRLYATMARLAAHKQGVLGFLGAHNLELLDTLLETTWGSQLHPDFMSDNAHGYALLVGESEIIPAWTEDTFTIEWSDGDKTTTVDYSDLPYASLRGKDKRPEIVLGRIVGNSPAALITPLETSIAVATGTPGYSFDRSHAMAVSGRGTSVEEDFIPGINMVEWLLDAQGVDVTKIHWKYDNEPSYTYVFTDATPGKDIVHFFGHGNVGTWGPGLGTGLANVWPLDFAGSNPLVIGTTCLSGGYEPDADSMPERFAESGAGAFIGATQVSANACNRSAGNWFYMNWGADEAPGRVLTALKQVKVSDDAYWRLWAYEYNFYGDPKYGIYAPTLASQAVTALEVVAPAATAMAAATLEVDIPAPLVSTSEGWDSVEIPGGGWIMAPDQYRVPTWLVTVDYPAGVRPQAVTVLSHTEPVVTAGLALTVTVPVTSEPASIVPAGGATAGWYPRDVPEVSWRVEDSGDGSSQLLITLAPFRYDSTSGDGVFTQHYTLDIQTIAAAPQIEALALDSSAYAPGETASIELLVGNPGEPQDVIVGAEIRSNATEALVAGFPLRAVDGLTGTVSVGFAWDTGGVAPGSYEVRVTLYDAAGAVLDSDVRDLRVGEVAAEVTRLTAVPALVKAGVPTALSMDVRNTGSLPLDGTATFLIQDEAGATLATLTRPVSALAAGAALQVDAAWTPPASAVYRVVGWVAYQSTGTEARVITLSPTAHLYLPLVVR